MSIEKKQKPTVKKGSKKVPAKSGKQQSENLPFALKSTITVTNSN